MIKTLSKIIVLVTMIVFGATMVFAQKSNTNKATFGEFGTDVDDFRHSVNWKNLELNNFFAFSSFGLRTTPQGVLDVGAAFKVAGLYTGVYYNGSVVGYGDPNSSMGKANLYNTDGTVRETVNYNRHRKFNPHATYGALVGLSNGMGIKLTFIDNLTVTDPAGAAPANNTRYGANWNGSLTPAIEVGGAFGPISIIGLAVPIVYDRNETMDVLNMGSTVTFETTAAANNSNDAILGADGNYVQPKIYLRLNIGEIVVDNTLAFNIYGAPAHAMGGKAGMQMGVGNVSTYYDAVNGDTNMRTATWDNRFHINDLLEPWYNIGGEVGNLAYSASIGLPIKIGVTAHALNYKVEGPNPVEVKDYYKGSEFNLGIAPWLTAAAQYRLFDMLSLQAGIGLTIFDWSMVSQATTKVDLDATQTANLTNTGSPSSGSGETNFNFMYPQLSFAAGFTFNYKQMASLDMMFIQRANPSAAGTLYKAVGDGLRSDTSILLTIKL